MLEIIEKHIATVASTTLDSQEAAENFRIHYLGKKGILQALFADFKNVPGDQKRAVGQSLNQLKT
ncbi:MAG: phenylalanine--tRNA ligase subunit alpha, partial [Schleiferiaceae bacterium]